MAEYDSSNIEPDNGNTNNPENADQVSNSQNEYNKVPDYSFWAEQVPNGSNANYNNPNSNNYNNYTYPSSQYQYNANGSGQESGNQNYQNANYPYSNYQGYNQNNGYQNNNYQNNQHPNYNYANNPYPNSVMYNYTRPEKKPRKPMNKGVKFLLKAVCFGVIAGASFFGVSELYYSFNPDATSKLVLENTAKNADNIYEIGYTEPAQVKTDGKSIIEDVVNNTLPAIVSINIASSQSVQWFGQTFEQPSEGSGSGIIVGMDEKELLVATNNHVVEGASTISVTFADGTQAEAIVKGTDSTADLAVVAVDITALQQATRDAITVAKLGNSDDIKVGQMVVAIGNALGYGQSVTVGYVSAKDRKVDVSDGYNAKSMILLQTDAAINPGNSGGALINMAGEVIGINTVKYASEEVEGMGYAIPITKATPIINELMTREILTDAEKGYLGIVGFDVTEEVSNYYNIPIGVFVDEVSQGGASEKAGIKAEDIIIKADDLEISSISQLREYVNSLRVGTVVKITYMRNTNGQYEEGTLDVTLGKNPTLN